MVFVGATDNKADTVVQIASCVLRDLYINMNNLTVELTGSMSAASSNTVFELMRCGL